MSCLCLNSCPVMLTVLTISISWFDFDWFNPENFLNLFLCCQCEEWPDAEHRVSKGVNGRTGEKVSLSLIVVCDSLFV